MAYSIESLILKAKENMASDLLISVGQPPMIRQNTKLVCLDLPKVSQEDVLGLIRTEFSEADRKTLEEQGSIEICCDLSCGERIRADVIRHMGEYAINCRIIPDVLPGLFELGLPESVVKLLHKKHGLILVTGPKASGKSTTMAALIADVNANRRAHIITLEKPVEYLHKQNLSIINQCEIGVDVNDYVSSLNAAIRQNPDLILIDMLCEPDAIEPTLRAAESCLVIAGLHTTGVVNTINRFVDMLPQEKQQQVQERLAYVLEAVISQQLIPLSDGSGCGVAYEIMQSGNVIRNLIREGKTHQIDSVLQTEQRQGMQTMDDAVYELYLKRKIDAATALDYAVDSFILAKKL